MSCMILSIWQNAAGRTRLRVSSRRSPLSLMWTRWVWLDLTNSSFITTIILHISSILTWQNSISIFQRLFQKLWLPSSWELYSKSQGYTINSSLLLDINLYIYLYRLPSSILLLSIKHFPKRQKHINNFVLEIVILKINKDMEFCLFTRDIITIITLYSTCELARFYHLTIWTNLFF